MRRVCLIAVPLAVIGLLVPAAAAQSVFSKSEQIFHLQLRPTQNAPAGAVASMKIETSSGRSTVRLTLTGLYPNTVYTIWTVFNILNCATPAPEPAAAGNPYPLWECSPGHSVPSISANTRPGFPQEGNGVSPVAKLGAGFTAGMGPDPGLTVITNDVGDGLVAIELDYDVITAAPVSNRDVILQCSPRPAIGWDSARERPICPDGSRLLRITTGWLRQFIGQYPIDERAVKCAHYDARMDEESPEYDPTYANGQNAALWQCVRPATQLPRVHVYEFDHFRLANHPDDLTHGFIGGNAVDHWIDMVGRRCDLHPLPHGQTPC